MQIRFDRMSGSQRAERGSTHCYGQYHLDEEHYREETRGHSDARWLRRPRRRPGPTDHADAKPIDNQIKARAVRLALTRARTAFGQNRSAVTLAEAIGLDIRLTCWSKALGQPFSKCRATDSFISDYLERSSGRIARGR
jgi:hypothetical protein